MADRQWDLIDPGAAIARADATAIALTASAKREQDRLDLTLSFNLADLDLSPSGGVWK